MKDAPLPPFGGPASRSDPPDPSPLEWETEMKLLNNRFFLGDLTKWTVVTTIVFAAILIPLLGFSGGREGLEAAILFLALPPVLIFVSTLIFILLMGNRLPLRFRIDAEGLHMKSVSRRVRNINRTAMILGALAGKPGAVGAGAIGASQENTSIGWEELSKVRFHPADRVVFLKGGIFSRIRVYATPQNYESVAERIRNRLPAHAEVTTF